eukprot:4791072-Alexandrium_andersonii.AAC.1
MCIRDRTAASSSWPLAPDLTLGAGLFSAIVVPTYEAQAAARRPLSRGTALASRAFSLGRLARWVQAAAQAAATRSPSC